MSKQDVMEAIERYIEYRELSAHDQTLANRWLNYHRGEYSSWKIGDDIRNRREQARRDGTLAQVEPKLREREATLRRLLAELFEQKQEVEAGLPIRWQFPHPDFIGSGYPDLAPTFSCTEAALLQSREHGLGDLDVLNGNAGKVGNRQLIVGGAAR